MFLKWSIPQGSEGWGKYLSGSARLKKYKKWVGHLCGALGVKVRGPVTKRCWNVQHTLCCYWTGWETWKNMGRNVSKQFVWGFLGENCILIGSFGAILWKKSIKSLEFLLKLNFFWKRSRNGLQGCLGQQDNSSNSFENRGVKGKPAQFTLCYLDRYIWFLNLTHISKWGSFLLKWHFCIRISVV